MGRPRKWDNEAQRKAAQRSKRTDEDKRTEEVPSLESIGEVLPKAPLTDQQLEELRARKQRELKEQLAAQEALAAPPVRSCSWSEDEYVAHELAVTRAQYPRDLTVPGPDGKPVTFRKEERWAASERYLRWRYQAFLRGEVSSL